MSLQVVEAGKVETAFTRRAAKDAASPPKSRPAFGSPGGAAADTSHQPRMRAKVVTHALRGGGSETPHDNR
jgi:hypothetical protein